MKIAQATPFASPVFGEADLCQGESGFGASLGAAATCLGSYPWPKSDQDVLRHLMASAAFRGEKRFHQAGKRHDGILLCAERE